MTQQSYGIGFDNVWEGERRRLTAAQELFDPSTFRHLDTLGIREGMRCLEIGGGAGSVARRMAERVGATGFVLVTDLDLRHLQGLGGGGGTKRLSASRLDGQHSRPLSRRSTRWAVSCSQCAAEVIRRLREFVRKGEFARWSGVAMRER